jgi:Ca2+-binding EF-hand superfamily protein
LKEEDANYILKLLDKDQDGQIDISEYVQNLLISLSFTKSMVQMDTKMKLGGVKDGKIGASDIDHDISPDVEYSFCKVLENEIDMFQKLCALRKEIYKS